MLEKLFIGTFILTLLVGSALGLVVVTESDKQSVEDTPLDHPSFKIYSFEDAGVQNEDDNDDYLLNLIRRLRRDVKAIPAVTAPVY